MYHMKLAANKKLVNIKQRSILFNKLYKIDVFKSFKRLNVFTVISLPQLTFLCKFQK